MSLINSDSPLRNAAGPNGVALVSARRTFDTTGAPEPSSSSLPVSRSLVGYGTSPLTHLSKYNLDDPSTSAGHLPVELLYTIIEFYLEDNVPPRELALVCKQWKGFIQGAPALWRNLHAFPVDNNNVVSQSRILERRIRLSGSTLLNVKLDVAKYNPIRCHRIDLFQILARTGLERWQALQLDGRNEFCSIIPFDGIFKGQFTSLQSLMWFVPGSSDPFGSIEQSVVRSKPPLKVAKFHREFHPRLLYGTATLQQVSELHANSETIQKSGPYPELRKLCVSLYDFEEDIDPTLFPPLPPYMEFSSRLKRSRFATLQLQMVENLVFEALSIDKDDGIIELPNLVSLVIETGVLATIRRISAPKLTFLKVGREVMSFFPHPTMFENDKFLPDKRGERLLVKPTSVMLSAMVPTVPTIVALSDWPQIEHLSMRLHESSWELFMENFAQEKAKICPNLKTLSLFLISEDVIGNGTSTRCEEFIKRLWNVRQSPSLQAIKWTPYFYNKGSRSWNKKDEVVYPAVNTGPPNYFASNF